MCQAKYIALTSDQMRGPIYIEACKHILFNAGWKMSWVTAGHAFSCGHLISQTSHLLVPYKIDHVYVGIITNILSIMGTY